MRPIYLLQSETPAFALARCHPGAQFRRRFLAGLEGALHLLPEGLAPRHRFLYNGVQRVICLGDFGALSYGLSYRFTVPTSEPPTVSLLHHPAGEQLLWHDPTAKVHTR